MNFTKLLDLPNISVDSLLNDNSQYQLSCHSTTVTVNCPSCHQTCWRVKSHYTRVLQDLPITKHTVWLFIRLHKFICSNPECACQVFTEPLSFAANNVQRTKRLDDLILRTVAERSSLATSALLGSIGVMVKKTAICDLLKKNKPNTGK